MAVFFDRYPALVQMTRMLVVTSTSSSLVSVLAGLRVSSALLNSESRALACTEVANAIAGRAALGAAILT